MAIHIQDKETDRLVRAFADRRGLGITAAIKTAVAEADLRDKEGGEALMRKLEPVLAKVRRARKGRPFSAKDDKAFMDEMWGEKG